MRVNLPVTQREYPFPSGQTLLSTTDLQGRILYCNPSFVQVSGYAREELLGQPHNMIRHPDMPAEAFRDMWDTIASGRPWSAPVKNRRKNGDHYWVMANVTPLLEGGRVNGYMSVRTEASRAQIDAAEKLYARMRKQAENGRLTLRLDQGELRHDTPAGRVADRLLGSETLRLAPPVLAATLLGFGAGLLAAGQAGGAAAGAAVSLAGGLAAAGWTARRMRAPLQTLLLRANRMAACDLTATLDSTPQRGLVGRLERALNQLCVNVRTVVRDTRGEVDGFAVATEQIAGGNHELSERTTTQAASLQQTAATVEEITGTVRGTAEAATEAAGLAQDAVQRARHSSQVVNQVVNTMHDIEESSRRIGEIIQVIDGIAFQTNILALNAAVEAARAGDHGRGFAVVAGEVRALAQRSATAAREIKQLVTDSTERVAGGRGTVDAAREQIGQTVTAVEQVGQRIEHIHHGASEQLNAISQVNAAVSQLDGLTQQNAAMVEELAASAGDMRGKAGTLKQTVRMFRLDAGETAEAADAVALRKAARTGRG
jgi:aerotaxis receptor